MNNGQQLEDIPVCLELKFLLKEMDLHFQGTTVGMIGQVATSIVKF